jgi:hypothetical protein
VIVREKLRRSAGSGKFVFIVDGRSSSVKSGICYIVISYNRQLKELLTGLPFCTRICAALVLGFFFAAASSFFFMLQIYRKDEEYAFSRHAKLGVYPLYSL